MAGGLGTRLRDMAEVAEASLGFFLSNVWRAGLWVQRFSQCPFAQTTHLFQAGGQ